MKKKYYYHYSYYWYNNNNDYHCGREALLVSLSRSHLCNMQATMMYVFGNDQLRFFTSSWQH